MTSYHGIFIPTGFMKDGEMNKLVRPDYMF